MDNYENRYEQYAADTLASTLPGQMHSKYSSVLSCSRYGDDSSAWVTRALSALVGASLMGFALMPSGWFLLAGVACMIACRRRVARIREQEAEKLFFGYIYREMIFDHVRADLDQKTSELLSDMQNRLDYFASYADPRAGDLRNVDTFRTRARELQEYNRYGRDLLTDYRFGQTLCDRIRQ